MEELVKTLEAINNNLTRNYLIDIAIVIIPTLVGTLVGAILAFWYSDKIQRRQARFNYLIEIEERVIESHLNILLNLERVFEVKQDKNINKKDKLRELGILTQNQNLSISKIQILAHSMSKDEPLRSTIGSYTEILVQLYEVFELEKFKDKSDISEVIWNYDKDQNGDYKKHEPVDEVLSQYILKILDLIGNETSKYLKTTK